MFSETGNDEYGEPLFGFTHRTFMEFFAAEQIAQESETPEALAARISPYVQRGDWDTLAQLAVQIVSKRKLGSTDRVITQLLTEAGTADGVTLLDFVVRLLEILVPKPGTTEAVTRAVLADSKRASSRAPSESQVPVVRSLLAAGPENRDAIEGAINLQLESWLSSDDRESWIAVMDLLDFEPMPREMRRDGQEWWRSARARFQGPLADKIRQRALDNLEVSVTAVKQGTMKLTEALHRWGGDTLVTERRSRISGARMRSLLADIIEDDSSAQEATLTALCELPTPWFGRRPLERDSTCTSFVSAGPPAVATGARLGLWLVLTAAATETEADAVRTGRIPRPRIGLSADALRMADRSRSPAPLVIMRRWGYGQEEEARESLRRCKLPKELRALLRAWMDAEVDFARA